MLRYPLTFRSFADFTEDAAQTIHHINISLVKNLNRNHIQICPWRPSFTPTG